MCYPTLHILWPIDEGNEGFILGRKHSATLVVIGIGAFLNRRAAEYAVEQLNKHSKEEHAQHPVRVLGNCYLSSERRLDISWDEAVNAVEHFNTLFVLYDRPKPHQRFHYSLNCIDLDSLLAIQASSEHKAGRDRNMRYLSHCSKTRLSGNGLNDTLMNELSLAWVSLSLLQSPEKQMSSANDDFKDKAPKQSALDIISSVQPWLLHLRGIVSIFSPYLASGQQIELRLEQIGFILHQLMRLGHFDGISNKHISAQYICAQNCLWLILNDIIIGVAVGIFLIENRTSLSRATVKMSELLLVSSMKEALHWLNNWPAGLKLNTELSQFFFQASNIAIDVWRCVINMIAHCLPTIFFLQGLSGVFGMTMIIALSSDLASLFTLQISVSYATIRLIFKYQLLMANSLFNLFRGKRYNNLRKRLDDWNYDLDQLLLGAMLFTLISFLFPTITTFYMLFALSKLLIILLHAGFEVALAMLNHFPLFALTLRLKDPKRLPGGIILVPVANRRFNRTDLLLQNSPLAYSRIFSQYFVLGARLSAYYSPLRLFGLLIRGDRLKLIPKHWIRYTYKFESNSKSTC